MTIIFDEYVKLYELIEYVSEPDSIDVRAERLKEATDKVPEFKRFFFESFNPSYNFSDVLNEGAMDIKCRNDLKPYAYGYTFQQFINSMAEFDNNGVKKPFVKYSHLLQLLDEIHEYDVDLILALMRNEVVYEKITKLVIQKVFPELVEKKKK